MFQQRREAAESRAALAPAQADSAASVLRWIERRERPLKL
jgi:hypothetical protein